VGGNLSSHSAFNRAIPQSLPASFPHPPMPVCVDVMITATNTGGNRPNSLRSFVKSFFIDDVLPAVMTLERVVFIGISGALSVWL
jgi:hypothetical protein